MRNGSISLPVRKIEQQDSDGFPIENWEFMGGVRAAFRDATRQDELLANQCGYKATVLAEIAACAYNGASFFVDEATGEVYDIKRTYRPRKSYKIQLTGEKREYGKL